MYSLLSYAIVDNYRLHIADTMSNYGGNINSYNNLLTRTFARIFRKTITVTNINQKKWVLNKKSYKKFLKTNKIQVKKPSNFKNFTTFMQNTNKPDWKNNGFIRDRISHSTSAKLLKKLVFAIRDEKVNKAKEFALQGANINKPFWDRGYYDFSFNRLSQDLPRYRLSFTAYNETALCYASRKKLSNVVSLLAMISSVESETSSQYKFKRIIDGAYTAGYIPHSNQQPHTVILYHDKAKFLRETIIPTKQLKEQALNEVVNN